MRIAHVINGIGLGGVTVAVYEMLRALGGRRYEFSLGVLKPHAQADTARQEIVERFRGLGVDVYFFDRDRRKLKVVGDLVRWFGESQFDIVHTHSYAPNLYARLAAATRREQGMRIVAHYHSHNADKWTSDGTLDLERRLASMSDALIACSASVRDHVVAVTGAARDAFDVVHNGADLARFSSVPTRRLARRQLGLAQNAKLIGMVGRIAPEKGQLEFVAAADLIARTHSDARFVIAGSVNDAEYAQKVQALIREHGLGERMALSGFVQNVSALYAALNVVVVPSLREGFGLSVLEAMAAARPIVASDVDGISEIVSDSRAAWLVPAGDTHALARAVTHVLGEREETRAMCVRARQVAQHFTWARAAQRLDAIYRRISSPRASLSTVGDQVGVAG